MRRAREELPIELPHQRRFALLQFRPWFERVQIGYGLTTAAKRRSLVGDGQKATAETIDAPRRNHPAIEDDETGQILALGPQPVRGPGTHAGTPLLSAAGVHEVIGVGVLRKIRCHRADDRHVVDAAADIGEQIAYRNTALAVLPERPRAIEHHADVVELRGSDRHLDRLTMLALQTRLGVERIDLRRSAVHEQKDHARGPRAKMRRTLGQWSGGRRGGSC